MNIPDSLFCIGQKVWVDAKLPQRPDAEPYEGVVQKSLYWLEEGRWLYRIELLETAPTILVDDIPEARLTRRNNE
jgi:hypothetical protein